MAQPNTTISVGELVQLAQSGDSAAFAQLVIRYRARIVALALHISGSPSEAEDIAQDAFTKLWTNAPNWRPPEQGGAKFTTWFHRVVVNLCIDYKRKQRTTNLDNIAEPEDEKKNSIQILEQKDQSNQIKTIINKLPERQKTALILCYYEEHSNKEAAEIMGVGIKALESLLVRAKRRLRENLATQPDFKKEHQI